MILKANSERQAATAETRYIAYIMALMGYFVKVNVKVISTDRFQLHQGCVTLNNCSRCGWSLESENNSYCKLSATGPNVITALSTTIRFCNSQSTKHKIT